MNPFSDRHLADVNETGIYFFLPCKWLFLVGITERLLYHIELFADNLFLLTLIYLFQTM